jgi:hypothetical protein
MKRFKWYRKMLGGVWYKNVYPHRIHGYKHDSLCPVKWERNLPFYGTGGTCLNNEYWSKNK